VSKCINLSSCFVFFVGSLSTVINNLRDWYLKLFFKLWLLVYFMQIEVNLFYPQLETGYFLLRLDLVS